MKEDCNVEANTRQAPAVLAVESAAAGAPTSSSSSGGDRKRTRRGERFLCPANVTLHHTDFSFSDHVSALHTVKCQQHPNSGDTTTTMVSATTSGVELLAQYSQALLAALSDATKPTATLSSSEPTRIANDDDNGVNKNGGKRYMLGVRRGDMKDKQEGNADDDNSDNAAVARNTKHQSVVQQQEEEEEEEPWEEHYTRNLSHFFPVKNYIVRAFPSVLDRPLESYSESSVSVDGGKGSTAGDGEETKAAEDKEPVERSSSGNDGRPLEPAAAARRRQRLIVECGCGSGSVVFPLMRLLPDDRFVCFDISATAVRLLADHEYAQHHKSRGLLRTFPLDIGAIGGSSFCVPTEEDMIHEGTVDRILLIFVLGALPVNRMVLALRRMARWLKPGTGQLLFRDYAVLDHTHLRFLEGGNETRGGVSFVKGDGTQQTFFELEFTCRLFASAGLEPVEPSTDASSCGELKRDCSANCDIDSDGMDTGDDRGGDGGGVVFVDVAGPLEYHCNRVTNRKNGKEMNKVFVNGVFCRGN